MSVINNGRKRTIPRTDWSLLLYTERLTGLSTWLLHTVLKWSSSWFYTCTSAMQHMGTLQHSPSACR